MKRIDQYLDRMGIERGEWCWTIEKNPRETGFHAHALQIGDYIPQAALQEACIRAHAGYPDIRRIRRESDWVARYGLKGFGADGYGLKSFRPTGDQREALAINGGRLEHHSRAFFTVNGKPAKVREAERAAIAAKNGQERTAFLACSPQQIERVLMDAKLRARLIDDVEQRKRDQALALV